MPPGRCPLFSLCLGVRSLSTIKTMFYKHDICIYSAQRKKVYFEDSLLIEHYSNRLVNNNWKSITLMENVLYYMASDEI